MKLNRHVRGLLVSPVIFLYMIAGIGVLAERLGDAILDWTFPEYAGQPTSRRMKRRPS